MERKMDKNQIKVNIDKIKDELNNADTKTKNALAPLIDTLEQQFDDESDLPSLEELEVEHPKLTQLLNRIADMLSGIGI
jgi:hypothetical protein